MDKDDQALKARLEEVFDELSWDRLFRAAGERIMRDREIRDSFMRIEKKPPEWPTLKGRLSQPLTSRLEALEQLEKSVPLSEYGKKKLAELRKKKKKI